MTIVLCSVMEVSTSQHHKILIGVQNMFPHVVCGDYHTEQPRTTIRMTRITYNATWHGNITCHGSDTIGPTTHIYYS